MAAGASLASGTASGEVQQAIVYFLEIEDTSQKASVHWLEVEAQTISVQQLEVVQLGTSATATGATMVVTIDLLRGAALSGLIRPTTGFIARRGAPMLLADRVAPTFTALRAAPELVAARDAPAFVARGVSTEAAVPTDMRIAA